MDKLILTGAYRDNSAEYTTTKYTWVGGEDVIVPYSVYKRAAAKVALPGAGLVGHIDGRKVTVNYKEVI